jgi:NRPS condensation-like uncharacterized protein
MLQWNSMHPYNAVHGVTIPGRPDEERLGSAIKATLKAGAVGSVTLDSDHRTYCYGGEAGCEIRILERGSNPSLSLAAEIERQINAPFPITGTFSPFRFFVIPGENTFFLGLAYLHAVADAESIVHLVKTIVENLGGRNALTDDFAGRKRASSSRNLFFSHPGPFASKLAALPALLGNLRRSCRPSYRDAGDMNNGFALFALDSQSLKGLIDAAKLWGLTVNDVLLALLMKWCAGHAQGGRRTGRRRKISIGCIVNTRREFGQGAEGAFGLFLGSFVVTHAVPEQLTLEELAKEIGKCTSEIKRKRLYLATSLELTFGRLAVSCFSNERKKKLYQKHYPLWGGLTNMNINPLWERKPWEEPIDYVRAVSTGPATPLVLSFTTSGERAKVGVSYRSTVFSKTDIEDLKNSLMANLGKAGAPRLRAVLLVFCLLWVALFHCGCATYHRVGIEPAAAQQIELTQVRRNFKPSEELRKKILSLNPEQVSERDIREVLSQAPAPRIINIHGGIYPVHRRMISFSEFLMGMGYPGTSITNPGDGTYTFSCYENSKMIAGTIAWYYEREGLRPMMVGHSQGGMQVVKVLRKLAGCSASNLHVWNPLTWKEELECDIVDPLTGKRRPVIGLQLPYVAAVGAGGLTRILPNQWDMCMKLRDVPDSVEEFTGFYKGKDLLGGDFLGYGSANHFHAMGSAAVRNVCLPSAYRHGGIPDTKHLLKSEQIRAWINRYHPADKPLDTPQLDVKFDLDSKNILWAADVWYSMKKHWVLELQRFLRAEPVLEGQR